MDDPYAEWDAGIDGTTFTLNISGKGPWATVSHEVIPAPNLKTAPGVKIRAEAHMHWGNSLNMERVVQYFFTVHEAQQWALRYISGRVDRLQDALNHCANELASGAKPS